MALHHGKSHGWRNRLCTASVAAALSLGGASARGQSCHVLPPCPALVVTGPASAAPAAAPPLFTAAPLAPAAPPPAAAPAAPILLVGASVAAEAPPATTLPPPADAPAAVSVAAEAPPATTLPPPADAAIVVAPPPADAAIVVAPECPDTPVVPIPKWLPAALGDEPGDAKPSFSTDQVGHKHGPECESDSRLSNEAIGIQPIPERPPLIVELNDHFLSPGFLSKGIELPTGEIVRPSLWVFGQNQFGYNYFNNKTSPTKANELVDRLDLFTQLNFTATERILLELRPLDKERTSKRIYTRADFEEGRFVSGVNIDPETLFFEGDFGEIFPDLDLYDTKLLDYGFSIGRQPLLIQDGLLINADRLDAVTVTRNTLNQGDVLNFRTTGMFAFNQVHRNNDVYDPTANLFGLFTEIDYQKSTVNLDVVEVTAGDATGSAFYAAASAIQRLELGEHTWNSSFHVLTSVPQDHGNASTGSGTLLFSQLSMTPEKTPNLLYVSTFVALGDFSSAARSPEVGGPLGQVGILFASPAFGDFGAPLNNFADDAVGGAVGYQIFLDNTRKQLIFEVGARKDTNNAEQGAIGLGARYQQAFGQHSILLLDTFVTQQEHFSTGAGARVSWTTKF